MFIVIAVFLFIGKANENSLDYHYQTQKPFTIDTYCDTIFDMYDYDLENERYEHQECRLYINQKKICDEEERLFGMSEGLERCLADLKLNRSNVLNLMK